MNRVEIGKKFEGIVGKLYEKMGFTVEINKLLKGRSGALHEIDVYAVKKGLRSREVCIECKYKNDGDVTKAEVANFLLKTDDLRIKDSCVITNSSFSSQAAKVIENYGMNSIDGSELSRLCREHNVKNKLCSKPTPLNYMISSFVDMLEVTGIIR